MVMATFDEIRKANEQIQTTNIKGKEYAEVNQRIKAFRMVYPDGFIKTEILSNDGGVCVMKATVGYYMDGEPLILGTGTAYETEGSNYINSTSYIENCETSSIGRAIGACGFGIDTSVASAEEVANAIAQQGDNAEWKPDANRKATDKQVRVILGAYNGKEDKLQSLMAKYGIADIRDLKQTDASAIIQMIIDRKAARK